MDKPQVGDSKRVVSQISSRAANRKALMSQFHAFARDCFIGPAGLSLHSKYVIACQVLHIRNMNIILSIMIYIYTFSRHSYPKGVTEEEQNNLSKTKQNS